MISPFTGKTTINYTEKINGFVDLQYRRVDYHASGKENRQFDFNIDQQFNFFNPKFGLTYEVIGWSTMVCILQRW